MQKHLSDFSLNGPVRSVSEKMEQITGSTCNDSVFKTFEFDQNGYLIKRITDNYSLGYSESATILFVYDKEYNLIKETELISCDDCGFVEKYNKRITLFNNGKITKISLQMDDKILSERVYKYFTNGKKKEIVEKYIYFYKNPPLYDDHFNIPSSLKENLKKIQEELIVERTVFDLNGNIILEAKNGIQGDFRSKLTFTYDNEGNLIKKLIFKNEKEISGKVLFNYDILNKHVEKKEYDEDDVLQIDEVSKYNDKGNEIEKIEYFYKGSEMSIQITTSIYDKDDQLTEMVFISQDYDGNVKEERHKLPLSSNLNVSQQTVSEKITEYDYDTLGNWITKRIISMDSDRQTIYTRRIIYEP